MREEKGTHTYREIMGQFAAWEAALKKVLDLKPHLERFLREEGFEEIVFTGRGSGYYLSFALAAAFQAMTGVRSLAFPASEIFLYPERSLMQEATIPLLMATFRSRETAKT